jgi:hypothetical protein
MFAHNVLAGSWPYSQVLSVVEKRLALVGLPFVHAMCVFTQEERSDAVQIPGENEVFCAVPVNSERLIIEALPADLNHGAARQFGKLKSMRFRF